MGNNIDKLYVKQYPEIDLSEISGHFTEAEKMKLLSGEGFVRVPHEELSRLRVDVYPYLM